MAAELTGDDSLATLVADLDDSFWNAVPTPESSPIRSRKIFPFTTPTKRHASPLKSRLAVFSPSKVLSAGDNVDVSQMLQGIEGWDWDDTLSEPPSPKKPAQKANVPPGFGRQQCTRCKVDNIEEHYSAGRYQKVLMVLTKLEQEYRTVILQDDWIHTDIQIGDTVNIIESFTQHIDSASNTQSSITICSKHNFLILHPDLLITATALSTASQCRRRPLLSGLVRSSTDYTPALVWGNMLHEVTQNCMSENKWDTQYIDQQIQSVISKGLTDLVRIDATVDGARHELRERSKGLQPFAAKYLSQMPKPEAILTNTRDNAKDSPALLAIADVLDIEEDIWSPAYGLKGKVDVTVLAHTASNSSTPPPVQTLPSHLLHITNASSRPKLSFNGPAPPLMPQVETLSSCPTPFEIKTGKASAGMEHRAQTILYTLLAEERYGSAVPAGLLFYTQSEEVVRVPRSRNEVRALIGTRNELASWMMKRIRSSRRDDTDVMEVAGGGDTQRTVVVEESFLPPTIDDDRACKKCYVLDTCMLYRKAVENVVDRNSPIADAYELKTSHLTLSHCEFFKKWEALLSYEERDLIRFKKELWTMGAEERERRGRCFGGMVLDMAYNPSCESGAHGILSQMVIDVGDEGLDGVAMAATANNKIHRYTYRFKRSNTSMPYINRTQSSEARDSSLPSSPISPSGHLVDQTSLLNGHINVGDAITISVEPDLLALARGFVLELTMSDITVGVDHDISPVAIRAKLAHRGITSDVRNVSFTIPNTLEGDAAEIIFRLDRDELFGGMGRMRNNLAQLFYAEEEEGRKKRLRELIVDSANPRFSNDIPDGAKRFLRVDSSEASSQAQRSFTDVDEQATVWDLNSMQIEALRKALSARDYALILGMPGTGKTTVIAALICILVQLGRTVLLTSYTHSAVDTILLKLDAMRSASDIHELGLCGFGVLRLGNIDKVHRQVRKYTLAARAPAQTIEQLEGQLMTPPVVATTCLSIDQCVRNPVAREGGLDVSLFRSLSDAHPETLVELAYQYRMNEEIMILSNRLIYNDRLKCGNEQVAKQSLHIPDRLFINRLHGPGESGCLPRSGMEHTVLDRNGSCWLTRIMAESTKALFVDTDPVPARDSRVGDLVQNTVEAELVHQTVECLLRSGVCEDQIGIISLYRQQIKLLSQLLSGRKGIEILTADRSQGRDKDCIIVSMVRSNDAGHTGDLVKDWRRMNVSFTRARRKLVIFGSRSTLQAVPLLDDFFQLMDENGWMLQLAATSEGIHRRAFADPAKYGSSLNLTIHALGDNITSRSTSCTPKKRPAKADDDLECISVDKENDVSFEDSKERSSKKMKMVSKSTGAGILKGRPILQDLVNEEQSTLSM
ncbi:hypothetical protein AX17_005643 [Amanita inopinata Kibby_2008]|nr:hypothetical protein AX17_005643 [Amanita inopinata Kibby_2008]